MRHSDCYEESTRESRAAENAPLRYSLLGLQSDILEVVSLAEQGGAGPIGPNHERLYWNGEDGSWTPEKRIAESEKPAG